MISRTCSALLSLIFAPWVSAAPAIQHSELLLVEVPPTTCTLDLSKIQHHLCALVHDVVKIVEDDDTLTSPYIINPGAYTWNEEEFSASAARPQTMSDTPIIGRWPSHDSDAGRPIVIQHNIQSPSVNFPESHFSANVEGVSIKFVFLPESHMDQELDSVHVIGCTRRFTWESLHACDQELVESWEIALSDNGRPKRYELLQEEEGLFRGRIQWKRDGDTDSNSNTPENGASETDNNRSKDEGASHNVDIRGEEGNESDGKENDDNENEGNDEKPDDGRPEENPSDEQDGERELIPPTDHNAWSLSIILFMTSAVLIIATRLFYARLRGLLRSRLKSNRFRVGETILLRWAREDMNFDDEEEDTMVNGSSGLITGEEIPLKPSPRKNFVIQYGSAQ